VSGKEVDVSDERLEACTRRNVLAGTAMFALGGTSLIINLVAYNKENMDYKQIIDRLFWWYAEPGTTLLHREMSNSDPLSLPAPDRSCRTECSVTI
jgi:hypothetical protein